MEAGSGCRLRQTKTLQDMGIEITLYLINSITASTQQTTKKRCHLSELYFSWIGYSIIQYALTSQSNIRNALPANLAKLLIQHSEFVPGANHVFIKLLNVFWSLSKEWGDNTYVQIVQRFTQRQEVVKNHMEVYRNSTERLCSMMLCWGDTYFGSMYQCKVSDRQIFITNTLSLQLWPTHRITSSQLTIHELQKEFLHHTSAYICTFKKQAASL